MGITDKKLKDKRFKQTEKAIIRAFFSSREFLSIRVMVRRARISRSTLYRHHRTIYGIIPDYEEYILKKYSRLMSGLIKRDGVKVKTIYHQMLIFILKNKSVFKMVVGRGGVKVLEKMIKKIEVIIMTEYALPKNCEKLLNIYRKEVVGVIERWIKSGFLEDELVVLSDIMYLTKTMRSRLGPLNE